MRVYVYIYTGVVYSCVHVCACIVCSVCACIMWLWVQTCARVPVCVHVCIVWVHRCAWVYMRIGVCMCLCAYVCPCWTPKPC